MMCFFSGFAEAIPKTAQLSASLPPDVKYISLFFAPIADATCARATSIARRASRAGAYPLLALANLSEKYGSIASSASALKGVVAA